MPRFDGRWQSIERKLPLLIAALVLGTVLAFSWATYVRIERLLLAGTVTRMQDRSAVIARMIEQSADSDKARMTQLASDSAVRQFLITGHGGAAAREALWLGLAQTPNERGRIELRNPAGLTILDTAQGGAPPGSGWVDRVIASRTLGVGQAILGPLHVSAGSVYKEAVAAIPAASESASPGVAGYVSAATFLTAHSVQTIRDLIGTHAELRLGSPSNGVWTDLEGVSPPPPAEVRIGHTAVFREGIGTTVTVLGTPWALWVSQPRATVFAPMQSLAGELAVPALLFVVLGALGAWVLSRQISRPIAALADAAERVAIAERPSPPVKIGSHDEVARLRESFARMTARVNESRTELEKQVEEAHSLAQERAAVNADLRAAIAAAEEARDAARMANRVKSDFLAVLSQEVRTPLNAIIGYVELLRTGLSGPVTTDQKEKLTRVRSSADELLRLVNQLLDVERIGSSGEPVRTEPTDIGALMREASAGVERKASERGLTLVVEEPNPPLVISVDAPKLRQILVNLLSNAVNYTERGEVRVCAQVMDGMLGPLESCG